MYVCMYVTALYICTHVPAQSAACHLLEVCDALLPLRFELPLQVELPLCLPAVEHVQLGQQGLHLRLGLHQLRLLCYVMLCYAPTVT